MKKLVFTSLIIYLFIPQLSFSQIYKAYSSGEIDLAFKKLTNTSAVLYIAAHPDDENTRLISWLVNEKCVRTGYLSLTRGDGGQNLIGSEQGIELGIIRSRELIAARSVDGAEQFFTRAYDFGYSKSPEETFAKWDREEILSDVVYVIRKFRPDIIITRFATDGSGGHGHHTASAMLAEEAFEAAGDPARFPKQLKTVNIWKPKRLLYNSAARFWNPQADMSNHIYEDVGGFNKAFGKSYGEISAESRSMHKSQGFGSTRQRGEMVEYFKPIMGDTANLKSIFDRIDISASSLPIAKKRKQLILDAQSLYKENKIEACTKKLVAALNLQAQYKEEDYDYKFQLIQQTILRVNGVFLEANAEGSPTISTGDSLKIKFTSINRSATSIKLNRWQLQAFGSGQNCPELSISEQPNINLEYNKAFQKNLSLLVCEQMPTSHLYWLNQQIEDNKFISKQEEIGTDYKLVSGYEVNVQLEIHKQIMNFKVPVNYKWTNPEKGELLRNLVITPPAMVNVLNNSFVCNDTLPKNIRVTVKAGRNNLTGILKVSSEAPWKISQSSQRDNAENSCEIPFNINKKLEEIDLSFKIFPPANSAKNQLKFELIIDNKTYEVGFKEISYDHIPTQVIFPDAKLHVVRLDVKRKLTNIAYIPGAGDEVAEGLSKIGYDLVYLNNDQIKSGNLNQYDAIIIGVRAFNVNENLSLYKPQLMRFVENGGNLIVQYNTNSFAGPFKGDIGPYPFKITRERITDENAKVNFETPEHPVLTKPNLISEDDFKDWVQERSIYQAGEMDARYVNIFSMADPNSKPSNGSLIVGKYGKGNFIYTGLAFFRQIPAGVPGAYRLLVNLIELDK